VGLDLHPDTFTAAVFHGTTPHDARKLAGRADMTLEGLLAWAGKEFGREDLFVMEAGTNSFEIHRRLLAMGLRALVLESCHVGKHAKTYADNDKMAAARIVLVYLAGDAPCVWVPDPLTCQRRELLHAYQCAVHADTAAVNSLKSYLCQFGVRLGKRDAAGAKTEAWIGSQRDWSVLQADLLADHFANIRFQAQRRKRMLRQLAAQVATEPLMLRCMKLLGIGLVNAFALLAVIGDVRRFERPEKLAAYLGLNPGLRTSGRAKRVKVGVGKRGRADMRHLLMQGAHAVLCKGRATALGQWGWKLFARKGHRNTAVAAVARKLAVQVWHVLSGNPPTALEPDKSFQTKLIKLSVTLGKVMREKLQLPQRAAERILHFQTMILAQPEKTAPA